MNFFGREKIYSTTEKITRENVVSVLNAVLPLHYKNMMEEDYLYYYRRGQQPILSRRKTVREEINNKVVENHADEIVAFKNGYFLTQPAYYISRVSEEKATEKVRELNEYLYLSGKQNADNSVVDWFHTVGLGVLYVKPGDDEAPFYAYAIDPRSAFVVYSRRPEAEPILGVNISIVENGTVFDVFTKDKLFRVSGDAIQHNNNVASSTAVSVIEEKNNLLGEIPIIEYQYDTNRMGAFEKVLTELDAINNAQSNRMDGIEQFVQSLMVFYNCQLGEDEEGNKITPAYIREAGAIFLKSIGQDKADLKILSEQLDQTQTQVFVDDVYNKAMSIAGVPVSTPTAASTSDNVGAVYLRTGWGTADTLARNTEDLFKISNKYFDRIMLKILKTKKEIDLKPSDIDIQFTRNEMDNLLVKTQAALNFKALGLAPEIALSRSGVSNDPVGDVATSKQYIDRVWLGDNGSEPE